MKFGILKKFLTAFFTLSLIPLIILSFYTWVRINQAGKNVAESSRNSLIKNTMSLLEGRARAIAGQVELFLADSSDNLKLLSKLPLDTHVYHNFSRAHQRKIWVKNNLNPNGEKKMFLPLYREITFVDHTGKVKIYIQDGQSIQPEWNINEPFFSSFGPENYFREAAKLDEKSIYVSHLIGKHVYPEEQLKNTSSVEKTDGSFYYNGVISV